jgi:hypothetical protein
LELDGPPRKEAKGKAEEEQGSKAKHIRISRLLISARRAAEEEQGGEDGKRISVVQGAGQFGDGDLPGARTTPAATGAAVNNKAKSPPLPLRRSIIPLAGVQRKIDVPLPVGQQSIKNANKIYGQAQLNEEEAKAKLSAAAAAE